MANSPSNAIRSLLTLARARCLKEVRFAREGVVLVDAAGQETPAIVDGRPLRFEGELDDLLGERYRQAWETNDELRADEVDWVFSRSGDTWSLRPRKAFPATLEALAAFDPDQLASLRSLYGRSGMKVKVRVQGEPRSRDVVHAIVSERAMIGLTSYGDVGARRRHDSWGPRPEPLRLDETRGPSWTYALIERRAYGERPAPADVEVEAMERSWSLPQQWELDHADDHGVPTVMIDIPLVDSHPRGTILFSNSAKPFIDADASKDLEMPWSMVAAERKRRQDAAPKRQRTWLETTAKVGAAFVAGEIPRGYVGGNSLFFHGPIAYSGSSNNPIAAFFEGKDGQRILIVGRTWDGDAVTSMSLADIRVPEGTPVVMLGDLRGIVDFAGTPASEVPWRFKRTKDEATHPRTVGIDQDALAKWYRWKEEKLREEVAAAHSSGVNYATKRKAHSLEALVRLDAHAVRTSELLGVRCPRILDLDDIKTAHEEAVSAFNEREEAIAARQVPV